MIGKAGDIGTIVIEHGAAAGNPGDSRVIAFQLDKGSAFHIGIDIFRARISSLKDASVSEEAGVQGKIFFDLRLKQAVVDQCDAESGG